MAARLAQILAILLAAAAATAQAAIDAAGLLGELVDLDRLTRWPDPPYATVQFSSSDRRTVSPEQPGWFANADGFGGEPIPAFDGVLRPADASGVGEYLLADVAGPGAIVRGWSAGMDGRLRVWLDDATAPLFDGKGYDFLARRSGQLVPGFAQLPAAARAVLQQEDADYLPIPFATHLRITWTGRLTELHFYQLQVRRYAAGANVRTFSIGAVDGAAVARTMAAGAAPAAAGAAGEGHDASSRWRLAPEESWHTQCDAAGGGVMDRLRFALDGAPAAAWRSLLLRITFDDSPVPQVETPLGDFSGAGPGLPPLDSAAFDTRDGLVCRWPMPFRRTCRIELTNHGDGAVAGSTHHHWRDRPFSDDGLYFHALWRVDHTLQAQAGKAPIDLGFVDVFGRGRLVGMACQIVNPPMRPDWRSNWWGEGDEKIAVDGVMTTLGTGTEDYFNYSWSHWRRFDLPFCGQPLATGPGNCGYASNHRLQIVDDLPFVHSLHAAVELWTHRPVAPLSYGRIVWFYASPGASTDHRPLQPDELRVPRLTPWDEDDFRPTAKAATWRPRQVPEQCAPSAGTIDPARASAFTRSGTILCWQASAGADLRLPFAVPAEGRYRLRLCCQQRPDAPSVTVSVDDRPLRRGHDEVFALACHDGERFEDLVFEDVDLAAGPHALALHCSEGGAVGIDLAGWELLQKPAARRPGAIEAESWRIVRQSPGLAIEVQELGDAWSGGRHLWVKATRAGDSVTFTLAAERPGRQHVRLRLTTSWDYGIVRIDWNGERAAPDQDLFCGPDRRVGTIELDLGERDLTAPAELTFTVVGHAAANEAPHCFFGIDCAVLEGR